MTLVDVTNALGVPLVYDRQTQYGVPWMPDEPLKFWGSAALQTALMEVSADLAQIGWLPHIEAFLTAGTYVKKGGQHELGNAIDFDGVMLKPNPILPGIQVTTYVYKYDGSYYGSLSRKTATRFACLLSRRFGVVLTETYNKAHRDHIHADLSKPVGWRGSKSQKCLIEEVHKAWNPNPGKAPWAFDINNNKRWLDFLNDMTFNPPGVTE